MYRPVLDPNRLINTKPISQYNLIVERVQCPICCLVFQDKHRPMFSCPSKHTICMGCLQNIVEKAKKTPQNGPSCPLCRQRIQLPLQLNEQFTQFLNLLSQVNSLQHALNMQTTEIREKSARIINLQRDISKKNQQIFQLKRSLNLSQGKNQMYLMQISDLKENRMGMKPSNKSSVFDSDSQLDTKHTQKQNIKMENRPQLGTIRDIEIEKKPPISELFDDMISDTMLMLARKGFGPHQVEFMVIYDMSKIIELNLSFNNLGNQGFKLLVDQAYMPSLKTLRVINNNITQLPNMQPLTKLDTLDLSNYLSQNRLTANVLRESEMQKLLAHKWEDLKVIAFQFESDQLWDNDATLDRVVEQWPGVRRVEVSQVRTKITKKKCQNLTKLLNAKAKRPNHLRIGMHVQNI